MAVRLEFRWYGVTVFSLALHRGNLVPVISGRLIRMMQCVLAGWTTRFAQPRRNDNFARLHANAFHGFFIARHHLNLLVNVI